MLFAVIFMMAGSPISLSKKKKSIPKDSIVVVDSLHLDDIEANLDLKQVLLDTTKMDSLQLAIYHHNKSVDDSIAADSMNRKKKNGIDAPVTYTATDSLTYEGSTGIAHLYGNADVKYQNMEIVSDKIYMCLDSSLVHATGSADTLGVLKGKPVFTQGSDKYESDTMAFNFKTKKGLISQVYTAQQDGYLSSQLSKRSNDEIFLQHGRYTTCDLEHPDFYLALSRAKVRPGKDVVFGPAYLVVCDVPLPFAVPYGFFPFTKNYSSGFIMPTYGDETSRGFYLRDGGYYFAINDKMDLKLLGEIYTKGSWGISSASNYRTRYKYNGAFFFSYQCSVDGEKNMPDYTKTESFKLQWNHRQDTKASPFSSLSASVNFASTSYERNNLTSMYNPISYTQSTRTSSVSWGTTFSSLGLSLSSTMNLTQNMRDSSIAMTLPDLNISVSRFYPFKRRKMVGKERWYEKIALSYTGQISNSINTKEDKLMNSSLIKDWRNGMQHQIPLSASFSLFNYINITPSFNFTDRMYSNKIMRSWDTSGQKELADTIYGLNNVYNWNMSMSASTKLYGFYVPWSKIFGDKIVAIRHVLTPQVSFSYAPDFGQASYGYWDTYTRTDSKGNVSTVTYSPYSSSLYGVPGQGKTGSLSMDVSNNIEAKIRSEKDSTGFKKISIIDELGASMSYNMAAQTRPLSDLSTRLRLKWWKNYTFNLNAVWATYAYELGSDGKPYLGTHTEYSKGRMGRFQGMSQNLSYTFNNDTPKKMISWIRKNILGIEDEDDKETTDKNKSDQSAEDQKDVNSVETNIDPKMQVGKNRTEKKNAVAKTDDDGYMAFSIPWSFSVSYGITMRENTSGTFNTNSMRYPYKYTQNMNFSGSITLSEGWNISFTSGYDFDNHKISMTTASLARDLHCFNMSCSVVLAPYTSYNFSFRCNASTLTDALKYDKRSSYSSAVQWY